jgi:hypothetical protein
LDHLFCHALEAEALHQDRAQLEAQLGHRVFLLQQLDEPFLVNLVKAEDTLLMQMEEMELGRVYLAEAELAELEV